MIKPCIRCRNAREEAQLRNVRGDLALEGLLVSYHPEILQLSENDVSFFLNFLKFTIIQD